MQHSYFGLENLTLTNAQRDTLISGLRQLGANDDMQPCNRNHWRIRPDNQAVIFEALWNDDDLTIAAFTDRLANLFNVAASSITTSTATPTFDSLPSVVVTFSRPAATARMRVVLFGGAAATWAESRREALAYLAANDAAWNVVE